ncbi:hypothetical protein [Pedobacter suwonensis]|uniref:hypothetical protein n=1 Tax=Pedobacter suwonensis TaxID=332999 RepID=UPI0036B24CEE
MTKHKANNGGIPNNLDDKIRDATGFFLEHKVAVDLEECGWQVIHNRYYLDDANPTQREMDIVAYKVTEVSDLIVYTALIISCKKSVDNNWIFMTRDNNGTKNNTVSYPLANFSNDIVLKYQMKKNQWDSELKNSTDSKFEPLRQLYSTPDIIFAFREYNNAKNSIANDASIYESINTLLKAQAYELNSLKDGRKESLCYYNFNLLSLTDVVSLIKTHCVGDEMENTIINQINYVNRFIVNKQVNHSVIKFVSHDIFKAVLNDYDNLHLQNCLIVEEEYNQFYQVNVFSDYSAKQMIYNKFKKSLIIDLDTICSKYLEEYINYNDDDLEALYLESNNTERRFYFSLPKNNLPLLNFLNSNSEIKEIVTTWFSSIFHYRGSYSFEYDELPF